MVESDRQIYINGERERDEKHGKASKRKISWLYFVLIFFVCNLASEYTGKHKTTIYTVTIDI